MHGLHTITLGYQGTKALCQTAKHQARTRRTFTLPTLPSGVHTRPLTSCWLVAAGLTYALPQPALAKCP